MFTWLKSFPGCFQQKVKKVWSVRSLDKLLNFDQQGFWHNMYFKSKIKIFHYINGKYVSHPIFWTLKKLCEFWKKLTQSWKSGRSSDFYGTKIYSNIIAIMVASKTFLKIISANTEKDFTLRNFISWDCLSLKMDGGGGGIGYRPCPAGVAGGGHLEPECRGAAP